MSSVYSFLAMLDNVIQRPADYKETAMYSIEKVNIDDVKQMIDACYAAFTGPMDDMWQEGFDTCLSLLCY